MSVDLWDEYSLCGPWFTGSLSATVGFAWRGPLDDGQFPGHLLIVTATRRIACINSDLQFEGIDSNTLQQYATIMTMASRIASLHARSV